VTVKTFIMLQNDVLLNVIFISFPKNIKKHNCFFFLTWIVIRAVSLKANQCIRLISEGSCDTNAFSPQGVTFDHASIFDVLGAL